MKLSTLTLLAFTFLLVGCAADRVYEPAKVEIVSEGITDKGLVLTYRAMAESMYYSPGVTYVKKGNQIIFEFVRSSINSEDPEVHLLATTDNQGNYTVTFPFPNNQQAIELIDSEGTSLGSWSRSKSIR